MVIFLLIKIVYIYYVGRYEFIWIEYFILVDLHSNFNFNRLPGYLIGTDLNKFWANYNFDTPALGSVPVWSFNYKT
jgi:hypothetical protein